METAVIIVAKNLRGASTELPVEDVRLELRAKNNRLYEAIMSRYASVADFCKNATRLGFKIKPTNVSELLNFKRSPFVKGNPGELRKVCMQIERALKIPAEDLFPRKLYMRLGRNRRVVTLCSDHMLTSSANRRLEFLPAEIETNPETQVMNSERSELLEEALNTLRYHEREILKLYYGIPEGETYTTTEIARIFKQNKETIRLALWRAIYKLRIPNRAGKLLAYAPEPGDP